LVWTTWTPDPKALSGPEPGYRPALTGLTGHDVRSATPAIDATGTAWVINLVFTPRGANLFSMLTLQNVAACSGDPAMSASANCPQRHLTIWANLTQTDIDQWDDSAFVVKLSMPFDVGCTPQSAAGLCPKFISDPITIDQITGGRVQIEGGFTQQSATALADAINASR
jgi:preprotein translocase subunit SecD